MKVSIILAHPNPGSFNHAIAAAARDALRDRGHQVNYHDLCAEHFDPLLPPAELQRGAALPPLIQRHCDEIVSADGIIVVHPNWWAQVPAVLKGWLDRVLRMGVAYRFGTNEKGEGMPVGLLRAQWAMVFTTSNTPQAADQRLYGDPLENFWKTCVWGFCGVPRVQRINYDVIITSTPDQRAAWLADVRRRVASL